MAIPRWITIGEASTTGVVPEVLGMSENGAAGLVAIPVAPGTYFEITDFDVAAGGQQGTFKLQKTNDGITWFNLGALQVPGVGQGASMLVNPQIYWKINGNDGPAVAFRVEITTPGGPTPVACNISGVRGS